MESVRQEYPALLTSLQPEQAINVLDDRVALINKINVDIADFLQERRRIEERYAVELRKLARRPHAENSAALGVFDMPWQRIVASTENLAQSHEALASKIEADVEIPLKQYSTKNREMQAVTTIQGNLSSIAKELSKAREKADRVGARGGRRADDAGSNVDSASREWESQSPYVFEQLQALDENRVNHLRDVLTQFQTHELDQIEKNRASTEACLNALLNVETADEIKTYAAKVAQGRSSSMQRRLSAAGDRPRSSVGNVPPAPPPPRHTGTDGRNNSSSNQDRLAPISESTPDKKSKIGGLKRLGTVMRGKKGAAPPPPQNAAEKKKEKRFTPFRRGDSSRSFQDLEESGRDLTPITSQAERNTSTEAPTAPDQRPSQSQGSGSVAPAELNGVSAHRSTEDGLPPPLIPTSASLPQQTQETQMPTISSETAINHEPSTTSFIDRGVANQTADETGLNLKIRDEPIPEDASEAQLAMNNMANQLRMQAQSSGMGRPQGSVRGRRDVRNTIFVPSGPELPATSAQTNSIAQPTTPNAVNTATPPSTVPNAASPITSPLVAKATIPALLEEQTKGSDANSVYSSHTLSAVAQHPDLTQPGLNASVIETVTSYFSETGVTQSIVVGEIAFSHTAESASASNEMETIRLQNFHILEKVAANPTFVTRLNTTSGVTEDQVGTFNVTLSSIRRPSPTVGLKYQFHIDSGNLARYSPVLITPAWQILDGQASVIVLYELNPSFTLPTATETREILLKNVVLSVGLDNKDPDSGKATSAMMAPTQGAVFRRKANCVNWRFPELKVTSNKERLLVRFMTEGLAKKGSIELSFEAPDITAGGLSIEKMGISAHTESDPFADDTDARKSGEGAAGGWQIIPTRKMLVTGRYSAS